MFAFTTDTFSSARDILTRHMLLDAQQVKTERWQGVDVSKNAAATSYELRNMNIEVPLGGEEGLDYWRMDCLPNLPWADNHFAERVCGEPLNPGVEWANWPWSASADKFRNNQRFNHNYMERLWPKYARRTDDGRLPLGFGSGARRFPKGDLRPKYGIAFPYGDLEDLVDLLAKEPFTRQAYIPLFFPEDTGYADGGRKVCTLGYQVLVRENEMGVPRAHIWYPMRSCDFIRHWSDDCYLAVRLLLWIIERCRERNPIWNGIRPGSFSMHMTSLHIFENDMIALKRNRTAA